MNYYGMYSLIKDYNIHHHPGLINYLYSMNKQQAIKDFKYTQLPAIKATEAKQPANTGIDIPLRQQSWIDYVDSLHRYRDITTSQAQTWQHPAGLLTW